MFYILCEGEVDKAEYNFVKAVLNEFGAGVPYVLEGAFGNTRISNNFESLFKRFKHGDTFVLVFDNVEEIDGKPVYQLLLSIMQKCSSADVVFRHTTYYCFEELFLSYSGLLAMLPHKYNSLVPQLKLLQSSIYNKSDYRHSIDFDFWFEFFPELKTAATREQFSARLTSLLLTSVRGYFEVTKSLIGRCWINDCNFLQQNRQASLSKCRDCTYPCKNQCFRQKLTHLDANSVSKLDWPFSDIFS